MSVKVLPCDFETKIGDFIFPMRVYAAIELINDHEIVLHNLATISQTEDESDANTTVFDRARGIDRRAELQRALNLPMTFEKLVTLSLFCYQRTDQFNDLPEPVEFLPVEPAQ